ncbi:MAG: hypothetical protein ACSHWQ_09300, partial [Spongiibacteraceae bacterium]
MNSYELGCKLHLLPIAPFGKIAQRAYVGAPTKESTMAINSYYPVPKLEEYSKLFSEFFEFKRENGILEVKMHTKGGPVKWSYQMHHALAELWT